MRGIGAIAGAAGYFVDAVGAQRARADDLEFLSGVVGVISHGFRLLSGQRPPPGRRARSCHSRCSGTDCRQDRSGFPLPLGRILVLFKQSARRYQEARRADAALQGGMLDEFLRCSGCSLSPSAMPSTVRRSYDPLASAPRTRQEQTSLPSSMMLQAPQSPVPQPSPAPVRPSRLRNTSSSGSSGAQTKSPGWIAVDRG